MLLVNIAAGAISQSLIALCNTQWMVYEPSSPLGAELYGKLHLRLTKL